MFERESAVVRIDWHQFLAEQPGEAAISFQIVGSLGLGQCMVEAECNDQRIHFVLMGNQAVGRVHATGIEETHAAIRRRYGFVQGGLQRHLLQCRVPAHPDSLNSIEVGRQPRGNRDAVGQTQRRPGTHRGSQYRDNQRVTDRLPAKARRRKSVVEGTSPADRADFDAFIVDRLDLHIFNEHSHPRGLLAGNRSNRPTQPTTAPRAGSGDPQQTSDRRVPVLLEFIASLFRPNDCILVAASLKPG